MLGRNYGAWSVQEPPCGWVRLAPNFVAARPRVTLINGTILVNGLNFIDLAGQVPVTAIFVLITVTFNMLSAGIVGRQSGLGFHTLWDDLDTWCGSSAMMLSETVVTAPGTVLGSQSYVGICPVVNKDHLTFLLLDSGGGFNNTPIRVSGYYD